VYSSRRSRFDIDGQRTNASGLKRGSAPSTDPLSELYKVRLRTPVTPQTLAKPFCLPPHAPEEISFFFPGGQSNKKNPGGKAHKGLIFFFYPLFFFCVFFFFFFFFHSRPCSGSAHESRPFFVLLPFFLQSLPALIQSPSPRVGVDGSYRARVLRGQDCWSSEVPSRVDWSRPGPKSESRGSQVPTIPSAQRVFSVLRPRVLTQDLLRPCQKAFSRLGIMSMRRLMPNLMIQVECVRPLFPPASVIFQVRKVCGRRVGSPGPPSV